MIAITEVDWDEVGQNLATGAGKIARHAGKYIKRAAEDVGDSVKVAKKYAGRRVEDYQDAKQGFNPIKKLITKPLSRSVEDLADKGKVLNKGLDRGLEDSGVAGNTLKSVKDLAGKAASGFGDQTKFAYNFYKNKLNNK